MLWGKKVYRKKRKERLWEKKCIVKKMRKRKKKGREKKKCIIRVYYSLLSHI